MPGEMPGVEHRLVNHAALMEVVLGALIEGDFTTALTKSAQEQMSNHLNDLRQASDANATGSFILKLAVAENWEELLNPKILDWFAIQYGYKIKEDGDLCVGPEVTFKSSDKPDDPTLPNPNNLSVYNFSWEEINWVAGYGLLLGCQPMSLLDLN